MSNLIGRKSISLAVLAFTLSSVAVRIYADADDDDDKKAAVTVPSHVSIENGHVVITLDMRLQRRIGLVSSPLAASSARSEETTPATILPVQELLTFRNSYLAAQLEVEKVQAALAVSQQEYERLKSLYDRAQEASLKSLQAAQGDLQVNRATLNAATRTLGLQRFSAGQNWGPVVQNWVISGSRELEQVLSQSRLLVQVTIPSGAALPAPRTITISINDTDMTQASYVSVLPRTDPLVQRSTLLYQMPSRPQFAPGMKLIAHLPRGHAHSGTLVPFSSIVWWRGEPWAYVEISASKFVRRQVSTDLPLKSGYFVHSEFEPGQRVVTRGGQLLLSEEFRSQIQAED